MQLSNDDQDMNNKYNEFRIFVSYGHANPSGKELFYCRVYAFSYAHMLERLMDCLLYDGNFNSICVQYGNSYADRYRVNGKDILKAHENTKLFKKMVFEYKMRRGI